MVTEREILAALQAGADGFMEKSNSRAEFLNAIEQVARGENYLCTKSVNILSKVMRETPNERSGREGKSPLTAREKEIIRLIAQDTAAVPLARQYGVYPPGVDRAPLCRDRASRR